MSMLVHYITSQVLYSTLQVLQNVSLLNDIVNNKKYLYERNIDHKSISVGE